MAIDKLFEIEFNKHVVAFIAYRLENGKESTPEETSRKIVHNVKECDLFRWIRRTNRDYKELTKGMEPKLSKQHVEILKEVGFPFCQSKANLWNDNCARLLDFQRDNGHCNVTRGAETLQLYAWVSTQRKHYKDFQKGKQTPLTEERRKKLESIDGFKWSANDGIWNKRYEELTQYAQVHGDCHVPRNYENNKPLASWVQKQRERYKARNGSPFKSARQSSITNEQIKKLEKIGFLWEIVKTTNKGNEPSQVGEARGDITEV